MSKTFLIIVQRNKTNEWSTISSYSQLQYACTSTQVLYYSRSMKSEILAQAVCTDGRSFHKSEGRGRSGFVFISTLEKGGQPQLQSDSSIVPDGVIVLAYL